MNEWDYMSDRLRCCCCFLEFQCCTLLNLCVFCVLMSISFTLFPSSVSMSVSLCVWAFILQDEKRVKSTKMTAMDWAKASNLSRRVFFINFNKLRTNNHIKATKKNTHTPRKMMKKSKITFRQQQQQQQTPDRAIAEWITRTDLLSASSI